MTDITNRRLLVLDGHQRAALAVTRTLGRRGVVVIVADHGGPTLAGTSRYCRSTASVASPSDSVGAFVAGVTAAADRLDTPLVLPLTDSSVTALHGAATGRSRVVGPDPESFDRAADKVAVCRIARAAGLHVPDGTECFNAEEIAAAAKAIGFSAVIKPARSKYIADDRVRTTRVSLIADEASLSRVLTQDWVGRLPCLVQAFIPGAGAGIFTLYGHTGPVAWFSHRRLREKPPSGGVSVLSESASTDSCLKGAARRLLDALGWFGPAMVEFRIDRHGKPWFMEVNGRFWGSLQLAVDCGVDFPWLYYQLCLGRPVEPVMDYAVGRRLRWELGDLDHLLLQLRGKGTADTPGRKAAALAACLNPFAGRPEVFRPDDPRPFLHELRTWFAGTRR